MFTRETKGESQRLFAVSHWSETRPQFVQKGPQMHIAVRDISTSLRQGSLSLLKARTNHNSQIIEPVKPVILIQTQPNFLPICKVTVVSSPVCHAIDHCLCHSERYGCRARPYLGVDIKQGAICSLHLGKCSNTCDVYAVGRLDVMAPLLSAMLITRFPVEVKR